MTMETTYLGNFECENRHLLANAVIKTGAPADNKGKGDSFAPTDLLVSAVAQCALITIDIAGKDQGMDLDITGAICKIEKKMSTDKPRRIVEIICAFNFVKPLSDQQKRFIEKIVYMCPVVNSLNADIKKTFSFNYI